MSSTWKKTKTVIKELRLFECFCRKNKNNIVFLCVGNSHVWYDSFGPIVGSLLQNKYNIQSFVYGNCENNITRSNLFDYIEFVKRKHFNKKIIVLDSAISDDFSLESVVFRKGEVVCAYYNNNVGAGHYGVLCPVVTKEQACCNLKKIVAKAITVANIIYDLLK